MTYINKQSRVPLYSQLMDIIISEIEESLHEHDKLSSERELCDKYNISRTTVRQAIDELEKEGYIYKVHGKGTFVAEKRFSQDLIGVYSFTEEMKKKGRNPVTKVLDFGVIKATNKLAKKMNIEEETMLYEFIRLRTADSIPMMLETTYVPFEINKSITKKMLEENALYEIFKNKCDIKIAKGEEIFSTVLINSDEAKKLQVQQDSPGLKIERFTYSNEKVIEYTISIARGDKFKYRVKLESSKF